MKIVAFSFNFWQYPLLMSIFQFIQTISGRSGSSDSSGKTEKSRISVSPILMPLLSAFSHLFAFIHEDLSIFIEKHSSRHKRKQVKKIHKIAKNSFFFSRIKSEKINQVYLLLLFLALGVVSLFPHSLYMVYASIQEVGSLQSFLNIIFTSVFCYLILKTKLFRHHYLAMLIIAIDVGIYICFQLKQINFSISKKLKGWGFFILLTLSYIIPTSIREVLEKYIMQAYFVSSPFILLFEGIFVLFVFIISGITIQFIQCEGRGLFKEICLQSQWALMKQEINSNFNYSSILTLKAWVYVLAVYFASFFRVETINKLTPTHRFVGEMLYQFYWLIYNIIKQTTGKQYALESVQVVLLLFAICLFNEFIIIQLCGLNANTRSEITRRANYDKLLAIDGSIMRDSHFFDEEGENDLPHITMFV